LRPKPNTVSTLNSHRAKSGGRRFFSRPNRPTILAGVTRPFRGGRKIKAERGATEISTLARTTNSVRWDGTAVAVAVNVAAAVVFAVLSFNFVVNVITANVAVVTFNIEDDEDDVVVLLLLILLLLLLLILLMMLLLLLTLLLVLLLLLILLCCCS
jgi:hypothetical protein